MYHGDKDAGEKFTGERDLKSIKDFALKKSGNEEKKKVNSDVIEVDHDTFGDIIAANPHLILSATSPRCGHCKEWKPIFE